MKKYQNFGIAIKKVRTNLNLTQGKLAADLKIHAQFISNCERGLCLLPKKNLKVLISKHKLTSLQKQQLFNSIVQDRISNTHNEWERVLKGN